MLKYLTGAAAIALAASAVMADPGGGKGGGKGGGAGNSGGGNPHAEHDGGKGGGGDKARGNGNGNGSGAPQVAQGNGNGNGNGRAANGGGNGKVDKASAPRGNAERGGDRADRGDRFVETRQATANRGNRDDLSNWRWADAVPQRTRGLIAGCPPGLAKKGNGCLPPGLARKAGYAPVFYDSPNWWNFDDRWHDSGAWDGGDYRYYDGYLVRYGADGPGGGIDSWLPLLGGALSPGNSWPSQYETQGLPSYYQDYYGVGQPDGYRYYDDTLYRIDPQSNAITAISALLTGDTFQVGQSLPSGYDVYNVPYSYRDRYPDGGESDYRYSDGSIYQVDTKTQIIQAVIGLLT